MMGISTFFLGMPPRLQSVGRHGPEVDCDVLASYVNTDGEVMSGKSTYLRGHTLTCEE